MIRFACPHCHQGFHVEDKAAGRKTKCPKCGTAISVPTLTATDTPSPFGLLDELPPLPPEGDPLANDEDYRLADEPQIRAKLGPLCTAPMSGTATQQNAVNPESVKYEIVCDHCKTLNIFRITGKESIGRCGNCGTTLGLPSVKAAIYENKQRAKQAIGSRIFFGFIAVFILLILSAVGGAYYYSNFTPGGLAATAAVREANNGHDGPFGEFGTDEIVPKKARAGFRVFAVFININKAWCKRKGLNVIDADTYSALFFVVMEGKTVAEIKKSVDPSKAIYATKMGDAKEVADLLTKYGME